MEQQGTGKGDYGQEWANPAGGDEARPDPNLAAQGKGTRPSPAGVRGTARPQPSPAEMEEGMVWPCWGWCGHISTWPQGGSVPIQKQGEWVGPGPGERTCSLAWPQPTVFAEFGRGEGDLPNFWTHRETRGPDAMTPQPRG